MKRLILCALLAVGCSSDPEEPTPDVGTQAADASTATDTSGTTADVGAEPDVTSGEDTGQAEDMGGEDVGTVTTLMESEPNDGTTLDEINDLPFDAVMSGAIEDADSDVFFVDATAGQLISVHLDVPSGSPLMPHIAVFDAGRDRDAAGGDYVKISRGGDLELIAMGEGGYYVAVRDARAVDGGAAGGPDHTYVLTATTSAPQSAPLTFPSTLQGTFDHAAAVNVWSFDGTEGMNLLFDFQATGQADGRLFVYSAVQGDWVARQDDRTAGDPNPLLDAPLFASGQMLLVVENIAEDATTLGYTIDASSP